MLTGDLVRPRLQQRNGELQVELLDAADGFWQRTATELIGLFRSYLGKTQAQWEAALATYEGNRVDYIILRGLAKVLSDEATFAPVSTTVAPAILRERLFAYGPVFTTPDLLHNKTRAQVIAEATAELGISDEQVEGALYADRPAAYMLMEVGPTWTPETLIARYNLELSRAALYWADQLQVNLYDSYKDFWRYLKLFKLMFWAIPIEGGYQVTLDGPISPFVQSTTRYGRQLAAFLPALFLCQRWQMLATVRLPQSTHPLRYRLDYLASLPSHFQRSGAFDSRLEADFAAEFQEKFGDARGPWQLTREDEVLLLGDTVMIPDFAVTHKKDGRRALIELVGYWHPDYLARKVAKAQAANRRDLILLIYEGVNLGEEKLKDIPAQVLYFATKPVLKEVMALIEQVAC